MLIGYTLVSNMSIKTSTILCLVLSVMLFRYGSSLRANRPPTDLDFSASPMRPYLEAFSLDRGNLMRYYAVDLTPGRANRLIRFFVRLAGSRQQH